MSEIKSVPNKFTTIQFTTKDGEKCTATKKDGIVTVVGDKRGVRQVPLNDFMKEFVETLPQVDLVKSPAKDTVQFKGVTNPSDSKKTTESTEAPKAQYSKTEQEPATKTTENAAVSNEEKKSGINKTKLAIGGTLALVTSIGLYMFGRGKWWAKVAEDGSKKGQEFADDLVNTVKEGLKSGEKKNGGNAADGIIRDTEELTGRSPEIKVEPNKVQPETPNIEPYRLEAPIPESEMFVIPKDLETDVEKIIKNGESENNWQIIDGKKVYTYCLNTEKSIREYLITEDKVLVGMNECGKNRIVPFRSFEFENGQVRSITDKTRSTASKKCFQVDPPKAEVSKVETPAVETPTAEVSKVETPVAEAKNTVEGAGKTEVTPAAETPKTEVVKAETPAAETQAVEVSKTETPQIKGAEISHADLFEIPTDIELNPETILRFGDKNNTIDYMAFGKKRVTMKLPNGTERQYFIDSKKNITKIIEKNQAEQERVILFRNGLPTLINAEGKFKHLTPEEQSLMVGTQQVKPAEKSAKKSNKKAAKKSPAKEPEKKAEEIAKKQEQEQQNLEQITRQQQENLTREQQEFERMQKEATDRANEDAINTAIIADMITPKVPRTTSRTVTEGLNPESIAQKVDTAAEDMFGRKVENVGDDLFAHNPTRRTDSMLEEIGSDYEMPRIVDETDDLFHTSEFDPFHNDFNIAENPIDNITPEFDMPDTYGDFMGDGGFFG